ECDDVSDTLAAILRGEPDWTLLPADVPVSIRTLLAACLAKDPGRRIADFSAVIFIIDRQDDLVATSAAAMRPGSAATFVPLWRRAIPAATVAVVATAAAYGG